MEHAAALPEPPYALRKATEEEGAEVRQLLSPETMGRNLELLLTLSPEGGGKDSCTPKALTTCSQCRSAQHGLYMRTTEGTFWSTL